MPVLSIDTAGYRLRAQHAPAAPAVLRTSTTAWDALPAALLAAGSQVWLGSAWEAEPPAGASGWLLWPAGERWLQGSCTQIRGALRVPGRRYFIPVHYP